MKTIGLVEIVIVLIVAALVCHGLPKFMRTLQATLRNQPQLPAPVEKSSALTESLMVILLTCLIFAMAAAVIALRAV